MRKKTLLTLASVFLAYRSVELVKLLHITHPSTFKELGALALAFLLNLFITGIFALLGFAYPTSNLLPSAYYRIRNPQQLTFFYRVLGVERFRWLLLLFFWGKQKNRKRYFDGTRAGLQHFEMQTRQSEFGHLAALVTIGLVSVYILYKGHTAIFGFTTLINVVGNFYPILLQRHHRIQIARIQRVWDRRQQHT